MENKTITEEERAELEVRSQEWWDNELSPQDRLFKLIAYKKAYNVDIEYPTKEQIVLFFCLEIVKLKNE